MYVVPTWDTVDGDSVTVTVLSKGDVVDRKQVLAVFVIVIGRKVLNSD